MNGGRFPLHADIPEQHCQVIVEQCAIRARNAASKACYQDICRFSVPASFGKYVCFPVVGARRGGCKGNATVGLQFSRREITDGLIEVRQAEMRVEERTWSSEIARGGNTLL